MGLSTRGSDPAFRYVEVGSDPDDRAPDISVALSPSKGHDVLRGPTQRLDTTPDFSWHEIETPASEE